MWYLSEVRIFLRFDDYAGIVIVCGEQTHFSALTSPAEKIAIFSAGEVRAEKCVCSPQARIVREVGLLGLGVLDGIINEHQI